MPTINEIERRWIVRDIDLDLVTGHSSIEIEQGYMEVPGQLRVRITDRGLIRGHQPTRSFVEQLSCELTRKTGKGIERLEQNAEISQGAARMLLSTTPFHIRKTRYLVDGWEVDFFHDRLKGLVIAEYEMKDRDEEVNLPEWIRDAVEVTNCVSNQQLARTSYLLGGGQLSECVPEGWNPDANRSVPFIVLTGGPCAGKSTFIERFRSETQFHCVPEVATIVMGQVGIMPESGEPNFQRALYKVQRAFEVAAEHQALRDGKCAVILDRGSLDSAAFIRGGVPAFEDICRTSRLDEYDRYEGVIYLEVPEREVYEANCKNNPVRRETWQLAKQVGIRLREVWEGHNDFRRIPNEMSWERKYAAVHDAAMSFLGE